MMQAIDAATGLTIAGAEARRGGRYCCPECSALVGLRAGPRKIAHFAHCSPTHCTLAAPESPRHRALKQLCKSYFAPMQVDWEIAVGDRRVDAMVDARFVIECQSSPMTFEEWHARTEHHNSHGFPVLWLWDVKRVCRKNTLAEALVVERSRRCLPIPKEIRSCHDESHDRLLVADKHDICPCQLATLTDNELAAAKQAGSPAALYWPHALRRLTFFPDFDRYDRAHFPSRSGKLRLVRVGP